jgi:hypothetical protein
MNFVVENVAAQLTPWLHTDFIGTKFLLWSIQQGTWLSFKLTVREISYAPLHVQTGKVLIGHIDLSKLVRNQPAIRCVEEWAKSGELNKIIFCAQSLRHGSVSVICDSSVSYYPKQDQSQARQTFDHIQQLLNK